MGEVICVILCIVMFFAGTVVSTGYYARKYEQYCLDKGYAHYDTTTGKLMKHDDCDFNVHKQKARDD